MEIIHRPPEPAREFRPVVGVRMAAGGPVIGTGARVIGTGVPVISMHHRMEITRVPAISMHERMEITGA
ncbi:MAG: hypothetical protein J7517_18870 [Sphingobium yanoikuyae]|nr:hypothetical protein [Sphingobium yanoikuyae]MBO9715707.1 hypothetical protein [Pseudoxanthomonas sp.]